MGSSIFHIGDGARSTSRRDGGAGAVISPRATAKLVAARPSTRLWQEAAARAAPTRSIGVRLRRAHGSRKGQHGKGGDDGGNEIIEFTVVGTAVRAPWLTHPPGQPIVTDLSGQELWALAQDGFEPTCFLFEFCRYHVWHVTRQSARHGEIALATNSIDDAREIASERILRQAASFGAEMVVGSDIELKIREVPCGFRECDLNDLDIDVSWFCTGIRRIPNAARRTHLAIPPLTLTMTKLGRRKDDRLDGGDDADDIERAAEDATEAALEQEEGR